MEVERLRRCCIGRMVQGSCPSDSVGWVHPTGPSAVASTPRAPTAHFSQRRRPQMGDPGRRTADRASDRDTPCWRAASPPRRSVSIGMGRAGGPTGVPLRTVARQTPDARSGPPDTLAAASPAGSHPSSSGPQVLGPNCTGKLLWGLFLFPNENVVLCSVWWHGGTVAPTRHHLPKKQAKFLFVIECSTDYQSFSICPRFSKRAS